MREVFREQLVKKQSDKMTWVKKSGLVIAPIVVYVVLTLFLPPFIKSMALIGFVLACASSVLLWQRLDMEYEYILLGKEMDVDIIFSKSKRKHLLTLPLEQVQILAPAGSPPVAAYSRLPKKDLTGGGGRPVWVMVTKLGLEEVAVFLELSDAMLEDLSHILPGRLVHR